MLISTICARFLNHCKSVMNLSTHTLRAYESDLRKFAAQLDAKKNLTDITKDDLRRYLCHLREQDYRESSIKRYVATIKVMFCWAHREQTINTNPFDTLDERIRLPKRLPRALDRGTAHVLRQAITTQNRKEKDFDSLSKKTAIQLLLNTGIRVSELSSIQLHDISFTDRCVVIHGKGNRQRLAYFIAAPLYQALEAYLSHRQQMVNTNQHLFVTSNGLSLTPSRIRAALHHITAQAGIGRRITPHMLRHTCATEWIEAGIDIRYVQKLLGHQSISTTEIYTHVSDQGLREALSRMNYG